MKIVHVIPSLAPQFGGPSYAAVGMTRALAARSHDVALYTTDAGGTMPGAETLRGDGVDYRVFPARFPSAFKRSPALRKALTETISGTDLVHIHALYLYPTIVAARIARAAGVPYAIRPCGALDPLHAERKKLKKGIVNLLAHNAVLRHAASFHFTTDAEREAARPYTFARPSFIVPNGVDLREFDPLPARGGFRTRHPQLADKTIVLFFGRINFKKGFEILIPAFAALARRRPDIHLVLAGPADDYLTAVQSLVRAHGIAPRVTFTGLLTGRERLEVLADSDLFVLPSNAENFSNALFEAMAAGLPVIVSDKVMTAPEVARAGAGLTIAPVQGELERALEELLADPAKRQAMGRHGAEFVRAHYGWDAVAAKLEASYEAILRNAR